MQELSYKKFSVSICVYGKDNPQWFQEAIDSVLKQTIPPSEVVLVVDGPVPNALNEIIKGYEELSCFKVVWLKTNQGHGNARRIGLENCSYDLVALMDADDICCKDRFEQQLKMFEENGQLSVVGGNIAEFIDSIDASIGYRIVPETMKEIKNYIKKRCPINQVTVMFKKSDVEKVGGYIDWFCEEDYYLWIRMYLSGMQFYNVQNVLVNVRVGKEMYQRRGGWKYFKSEAKLQKYMHKHKVIGFFTYCSNVIKRFIVQVLLPNKLRGWVYKKFARKSGL